MRVARETGVKRHAHRVAARTLVGATRVRRSGLESWATEDTRVEGGLIANAPVAAAPIVAATEAAAITTIAARRASTRRRHIELPVARAATACAVKRSRVAWIVAEAFVPTVHPAVSGGCTAIVKAV